MIQRIKSDEICPDCKKPFEIEIEHEKKRVRVFCSTCKKHSVIENGEILVDGESFS